MHITSTVLAVFVISNYGDSVAYCLAVYYLALSFMFLPLLPINLSLHYFTFSLSHDVQHYLPRLWGTVISDTIFDTIFGHGLKHFGHTFVMTQTC